MMRAATLVKYSNLNWKNFWFNLNNFSKYRALTMATANTSVDALLTESTKQLVSSSNTQKETLNNILLDILGDRYIYQMKVLEISSEIHADYTVLTRNSLECCVQSCSKLLAKELNGLFPDRNLVDESVVNVICLNHRTESSMSIWDVSVAKERKFLADLFMATAKEICETLRKCGLWADFIDPHSGCPFFGPYTNDCLFETDPRMRNFGYQILDLGCCKVLSHPIWKEHVFAGLIFTNAPANHPLLLSFNQTA